MADKNVDGIQANKEELERSRKIVLDYIGEIDRRNQKSQELKNSVQAMGEFGRSMDGVVVRKNEGNVVLDSARKEQLQNKIQAMNVNVAEDEANQDLSLNKEREAELKRKIESMQIVKESQETKIKELETANKLKNKNKLITAQKSAVGKVKEAPVAHLSKKEELELLPEKISKVIIQNKTKKRESSLPVKKHLHKKNIHHQKSKLELARRKTRADKRRLKKLLKIFFIFFGVILTAYLIFGFLILKAGFSNKYFRQIEKFFVVPKVVSKIGYIGYFEAMDIADQVRDNIFSSEDKINEIIKDKYLEKIVLTDLAKKYKVYKKEADVFGQKEVINEKILLDQQINNEAYDKLDRIKLMLVNDSDFVEVGQAVGDKNGKIHENEYNDFLKLKQAEQSMVDGQVSDVIVNHKGYYIIKKESQTEIKYIFVTGVTLEDYLIRQKQSLKVWTLTE